MSTVELILVGECNCVHDKVDLAPSLLEHLKHGVDGGGLGDIAMAEQQAVDFARQRLDSLFQSVALPSQCNFGAGPVAGLGNAPGDRAAVGDAEDHSALALHQT